MLVKTSFTHKNLIFSLLGTSQKSFIELQILSYIAYSIRQSTVLLVYHACYTAKARRCETVKYALKRVESAAVVLRVPAVIGWSGPALKRCGI